MFKRLMKCITNEMNKNDCFEDINKMILSELKQDFIIKAEKLTRGANIIDKTQQLAQCEFKNEELNIAHQLQLQAHNKRVDAHKKNERKLTVELCKVCITKVHTRPDAANKSSQIACCDRCGL